MKTRQQVCDGLAAYYTERFKGKCWASYDETARRYYVRGEGLPAAPDLAHLYPNGWSLLQWHFPKAAREILKLTEAKPKAPPKVSLLHAPELAAALAGLIESFTTGRCYDTQNPYTRPEVKAGLNTLKKATGFTGDWKDALDHWQKLTGV